MAAKLKWFASCPSMGLMLRGPYATQAEAYAAMRLTPEAQAELGGVYPPDLAVWPDDRPAAKICETPSQRAHRIEVRQQKINLSNALNDLTRKR